MSKIIKFNNNSTHLIKNHLENNGLIAFPTDTVYGIGCVYNNLKAINKLKILKDRKQKPLSIIFSSYNEIKSYLLCNHISDIIAEHFLPGGVTLILEKKNNQIPNEINPLGNNIGARVPNNKILLNLLKNIKTPLASSSANLKNHLSPTSAKEVLNNFPNQDILIIENNSFISGLESTVIDVTNTANIKILRQGIVTKEMLINKISKQLNNYQIHEQETNGFYSTKKQYLFLNDINNQVLLGKKIAIIIFGKDIPLFKNNLDQKVDIFNLSLNGILEEASRNLLQTIKTIELSDYDTVYINKFPHSNLGKTINFHFEKLINKD